MIELALNNPTMNVESMEYNIMRELNVNEMKEVNGGSIDAPEPVYMIINGKKVQISPVILGN